MLKQLNNAFRHLKMKAGFSLLEVLISAMVVVALAAVAVPSYFSMVERSRQAEALLSIDAIRKAELAMFQRNGIYLNAANTEEINALFALGIQENFFRYQVVDATDSDFRIIATRLGSLSARMMPVMITAGPEGLVSVQPAAPVTEGPGPGPSSGGGGADGESGSGGGSGGGAGGSSGGAGGGTSGGSGSGLTVPGIGSPTEELGFLPRGTDIYSNWPDVNMRNILGSGADLAKLEAAFDLVAASELSPLTDDLTRKGIPISVGDAADFTGDEAATIARFIFAPDGDFTNPPDTPDPMVLIEFNPSYMTEDAELLASVLIHEATHFGQYLDGNIINYISGLVSVVDIEFQAIWNQSFHWESIRDAYDPFTTPLAQSNEAYYQHAIRGEADLKAFIASVYL